MVSLRRRQVIVGALGSALVPGLTFGCSLEKPEKLVLSGRVLAADGSPACEARVTVGQDEVATDGDGRFVLLTTRGHPYRVTFDRRSAESFVSAARRDLDGTWRASFGLTLA